MDYTVSSSGFDNILGFLEMIVNTFSKIYDIFSQEFSQIIDQFTRHFGEDSIIGKAINALIDFLFTNVGGYSLLEIMLGVGVTILIAIVLWKFILDAIPLA